VDAAMQMLEDAHVTEDAFVALARDCHMIGHEGGTDESSDGSRGKGERRGGVGGGEGREGEGAGGEGGGEGGGRGGWRGGGKGRDGGKTAPAFGSSLDWGIQGGRPIFCGRPAHDKIDSSCEGGNRAEADRNRRRRRLGGGGGLTVEMISSCVFHAQLREQHRQEDRWLERQKKKYLESKDAEASTLVFDVTAHLATAFDAVDRKESLHASLGDIYICIYIYIYIYIYIPQGEPPRNLR